MKKLVMFTLLLSPLFMSGCPERFTCGGTTECNYQLDQQIQLVSLTTGGQVNARFTTSEELYLIHEKTLTLSLRQNTKTTGPITPVQLVAPAAGRFYYSGRLEGSTLTAQGFTEGSAELVVTYEIPISQEENRTVTQTAPVTITK